MGISNTSLKYNDENRAEALKKDAALDPNFFPSEYMDELSKDDYMRFFTYMYNGDYDAAIESIKSKIDDFADGRIDELGIH